MTVSFKQVATVESANAYVAIANTSATAVTIEMGIATNATILVDNCSLSGNIGLYAYGSAEVRMGVNNTFVGLSLIALNT